MAGLSLPFLSTACAAWEPTDPSPNSSWAEERQREWRQLKQMKSDLRWGFEDPVDFSFPGQGEVRVRDWWLEGGPGWEYVRAKFTYFNSTNVAMERVEVRLTVLDPDGNTVVATKLKLVHPWGAALAPGTMFSDEIKVPTEGAHLNLAGWHWTIGCRAVPQELPAELRVRRVAEPTIAAVGGE